VSLGYPNSAYGMSKVGLTAATRIQQRLIDQDKTREDIVINACCPGYVATDMSSFKGHLTIDEGAITPTYLALLPENIKTPRGEFLAEKQIVEWVC
jgi:carbonyl reductase 1